MKNRKELAFLGGTKNKVLLTAEQEKELAAEIASLREQLWRELLSYAPWSASGVDLLLREAEARSEELPVGDLRLLQDTSTALRRRGLRTNQDAFKASVLQCAQKMAQADLDGDYSGKVMREVNLAAKRDRQQMLLDAPLPPEGSAPFLNYVQSCRKVDRQLRAKKDYFVKSNLRLVIAIARRYSQVPIPLEDLVQEGTFGLMKSVCRFDGERGYRFSTYAAWWIRHAINRAIDNFGRTVRIPTHVAADVAKINRLRRDHEAKTGEDMTPKDIAKETGLKVARVQRLLTVSLSSVSLDAGEGDGEGNLLSKLEEEDVVDIESLLRAEQLQEQVLIALDKLPRIEREVLMCRFGLNDEGAKMLTLRQVGDKLSLSRERIRQLQEKALIRLRQALRNKL
jgi:RNA polymerase primary sigma factor